MFACAQRAGRQELRQWYLDSGATSHMCYDEKEIR